MHDHLDAAPRRLAGLGLFGHVEAIVADEAEKGRRFFGVRFVAFGHRGRCRHASRRRRCRRRRRRRRRRRLPDGRGSDLLGPHRQLRLLGGRRHRIAGEQRVLIRLRLLEVLRQLAAEDVAEHLRDLQARLLRAAFLDVLELGHFRPGFEV